MPIPLILIHGYSDEGVSFKPWKNLLVQSGLYKESDIHICNYRTLTNEVTIKDIAEGFDRALKINAHVKAGEPFDAMVHSTGMLVLRSWLTVYDRHERVKRIIALAPASFGSPLAHKGRSWIGSIFKGSREHGPDFMEAGDLVLDGLELGSTFTWNLAHRDLLGDTAFYGATNETPYVFTFCGNKSYKGLKGIVAQAPGSDGTVRWAGCALNARKITLNFTKPIDDKDRYSITKWPIYERTNLMMPFIPIDGLNHTTIIESPNEKLIELVKSALQVNDFGSYTQWIDDTVKASADTLVRMSPWQQFVVRAVDERGDPINDYNFQLYKLPKGKDQNDSDNWEPVQIDVHAYSSNNSYRCFHINLLELKGENLENIRAEFMASSGTELLGYLEYVGELDPIPAESQPTFTMDLTSLIQEDGIKLFYPFTTTFIEIIINREPKPIREQNKIMWFL